MSKALERFEYFLAKTEDKINSAVVGPDRAERLYKTGIRTEMFMLQGLCRVYGSGLKGKAFDKMRARFKQVEDALGAIDYYDGFITAFQADTTTPPEIISNLGFRRSKSMQNFEVILKDNDWFAEGKKSRINKIRKKLFDLDWPKDKKETKLIHTFYAAEIEEIEDFVAGEGLPFTKMEDQVHEFRRKLRWLSIYPQALRGKIQLLDMPGTDFRMNKYQTEEILNLSLIHISEPTD